jgi:putative nucleotidyltransferase with HDIG domain
MKQRTQRPGIVRAMVLSLTVVLVALALSAGRTGEDPPPPPVVGQPADTEFIADGPITVVDQTATAAAREQAQANVETVFETDAAATNAVLADVGIFFDEAEAAQAPVTPEESGVATEDAAEESVPDDEVGAAELTTTTEALPADKETQILRLSDRYPLLDDATVETMLDVLNGDLLRLANGEVLFFGRVEEEAIDLAEELLSFNGGITAEDLDEVQAELVTAPPRLNIPGMDEEQRASVESAVADLIANVLQDNKRPDEAATESNRVSAAAEVPEVTVAYVAGQTIVRSGEVVTEVQLTAITELDLIEPADPPRLAALSVAAGLAVLLSALFVYRIAPDVWAKPKLVALFGLFLVFAALAARLPEFIAEDRPELGFLIPAAAFGYLAAILFDPRTALLMAVPVGIFTGLATGEVELAVFAAAAAVTPVPFVSAASSRTRLRLAVVYTGLALAPIAASLSWFFDGSDTALKSGAAGFAGGIIAGVIALGALPFLETTFRITTTLTLLDLTDRNHPALRLLEEQAPGSFNHSILVGTLAGKASRAIGANPLLAQASAYYHDLGKSARPQYFIENQFGVSNPHDEIPPEESAEIIRRHVTDGLKMARQYRIPSSVADGIRMHHGTSIMRFFYHKALETDPGADPSAFRHHGVKPVRKEMAILMLSDACEASVRSLIQQEDPSTDNIAKLVDQVVAEKLEDGQLDESSLTFGELTKVKQALVDALIGYYHTRVSYPGFPGTA